MFSSGGQSLCLFESHFASTHHKRVYYYYSFLLVLLLWVVKTGLAGVCEPAAAEAGHSLGFCCFHIKRFLLVGVWIAAEQAAPEFHGSFFLFAVQVDTFLFLVCGLCVWYF